MAKLQLENVAKSYGTVEVIKNVSLDIADGEFVVFVGPSGCGKSTLLRMIAGLEAITDGHVLIDDEVCNDLAPKQRGIAMVFQTYALYPHKTVYQNMAFSLKLSRRPRQEIDERIREAARILQMEHLLDRRPSQLSGGQRQRVAIGRAIVRNPKVFLFDEPLSNLDAALRVSMRREIAKLHEELGATMIYVTHDQVEAMTLADRIVVLDGGIVQQIGTPMELYHHPSNLFVAGFIGSPRMNLVPGTVAEVTGDALRIDTEEFGPVTVSSVAAGAARPGDAVTLGIRPEHTGIAPDAAGTGAATVMLVEELGDETLVELKCASGRELVAKIAPSSGMRAGDRVAVHLDPASAHLFDRTGAAMSAGQHDQDTGG